MYNLKDAHWLENEKMGWYQYSFEIDQYSHNYIDRYNDIVDWILVSIDKPERHVRWHINNSHIRVKFRYEKDYLRFVLTWA